MPHYADGRDYPFAAFLTNLGRYNEGELEGAWLKFPTTPEELQQTFARIGIGTKNEWGRVYEEWFITDYDCYVDGIHDLLGEYANLDELNYFASKLEEMSQSDYELFQAAVELGDYTSSVQELINLTENLDCYDLYPYIHDQEELGRYYIEELDAMEVPEHLRNYIDYEAYGRDIALEEGGQFTTFGYVRETGDSFHAYYDGDRDSIPEEYRVMNFKEASQHDLEYPPEHNASEKLTVLVVEPGKEPYEKEIEPGLRSLQTEVGGDIAAVYPFDDPVALVLNDEGKLIGLDLNRALRDEQGEIYDIVAGTFLVMGLGEEDFASLPPEMIRKYTEQFKQPELFISINGQIMAIPMQPEESPHAEMPTEVSDSGKEKSSIRERLEDAKQECTKRKAPNEPAPQRGDR